MIELISKKRIVDKDIVRQLRVNFHKLELLLSEQRVKKLKKEWNIIFYRLMEIEAEIYCIKNQIQELLDLYFDIIED